MTSEGIGVVVSDGHEVLRQGLAGMLGAEEDIRLMGQASTARQARRLIEQRSPDVLITASRFPDGSAVELCEVLDRNGPAVLFYTADEDLDTVEAALEAGAMGYVLKSAPSQTLVQAVHLVARGQRYIDAMLAPKLLSRSDTRRILLSLREREVLQRLSDGLTTAAAARDLHLSPATVRSYAENAMAKLGVGNRTHAVAQALRRDLIS